jgi:hypothetical protein
MPRLCESDRPIYCAQNVYRDQNAKSYARTNTLGQTAGSITLMSGEYTGDCYFEQVLDGRI